MIQEQGHVDLEARCAGVKNTFPATEILNVNGKDMPSVESTITAKLQQDPAIDTVLTLGAPFALTAVQSVKNAGGSNAKVATFDTNAALVDAIQKGDVQWAVDQQPYLQGYLAVDSLWLYLSNKNVIGGNQPTLTGPSFIDKSNVDAVAELAKGGTDSDPGGERHDYASRSRGRRSQGRSRRTGQRAESPAAPADSAGDGGRVSVPSGSSSSS